MSENGDLKRVSKRSRKSEPMRAEIPHDVN